MKYEKEHGRQVPPQAKINDHNLLSDNLPPSLRRPVVAISPKRLRIREMTKGKTTEKEAPLHVRASSNVKAQFVNTGEKTQTSSPVGETPEAYNMKDTGNETDTNTAKEGLSLAFLNTAGGDQFDQQRKRVGARSPNQFAARLFEAVGYKDVMGFAEVPEMGTLVPTGRKRSVFLNTIVGYLGSDYQVFPPLDTELDTMLAPLGLALISRLPVSNIEVFAMKQLVTDDCLTYPYGALKATVEYVREATDVYITHNHAFQKVLRKRAFSPKEQERVYRQLEDFTRFLTPRINRSGRRVPSAVIGDLNINQDNLPAKRLIDNLVEVGYRDSITDSTIPGPRDERPDRLLVTENLTAEVVLFNADSDHYGLSALVVSR